jgi:hypothetical protein
VVVPIWVGVVVTMLTPRGRDRPLVRVGLAALAWLGIVVVMAVALRYAALSRFFLPAGAVLCVLGGVGLVRLVERAAPGRARTLTVAGLVVVSLVFVTPRVLGIPDVLDEVDERAAIEADLLDLVDEAGGRDAVLACGAVAADPTDLPQAPLAWHLDVPLTDITRRSPDAPHVAVVGTDGRMARRLEGAGIPLAANERWTVLAVDCPAALPG